MIHVIGRCDCWDCQTSYLRVEAAQQAQMEPDFPDDLESVIELYIRNLTEEGIGLGERLTVAAVLADLCALARIPEPLIVSTALREA